jgi:hypothetical protein
MGLTQNGIKGPNGNYQIFVVTFRENRRTQYNVAVLESPDQDWKYFNGGISNDLEWKYHVDNAVNKANHNLGQIKYTKNKTFK